MEPTDRIPSLQIGACGSGDCHTCGHRFSRGIGITNAEGLPLATLCQWCVLLTLDIVTDLRISEQVLDWTRRKHVFGRRNNMGQFSGDMNHREGEHAYIMSISDANVMATRCGGGPREAKASFGIAESVKCRVVQVPDSIRTHLHHGNGECVPVIGMIGSSGVAELAEIVNAQVRSGAVVHVI